MAVTENYPCTTVIGVISCFVNLSLSLISGLNFVRLSRESEIYEESQSFHDTTFREFDKISNVEDKTDTYDMLKRLQIATLVYSLIMTPITIPMIMGMRKQKPYWVTPWIVVCAFGIIGMACNVVITGHKLTSSQIFSEIVYVVIQSLIWIPIFILWSELRYHEKTAWQRIAEDAELYYIPVPVALLSGKVCRCKQPQRSDLIL